MRAALRAAFETRGHTWPNPCVGCVITSADNEVLAISSTQKGGHPHAELAAFSQIGDRARGGVCYVTLEPCNHTSPNKPVSCTDAIIAAGIKTIVIAMPDPDPRMMGQSIQKLEAAGLDVHVGMNLDEAYHAHRGHISRIMHARPYITLKLAHSRDGKLGHLGKRTAISGEASWQRTYTQRGKVDAVMIGIETALTDNPQLINRNAPPNHQPVRVVLDSRARLPLDGMLAKTARETPVWVVASTSDTAHLKSAGINVLHVPDVHDTSFVLTKLYEAGLGHILCEGGAKLAQSLISANMVDEALMIESQSDIGDAGIPCPHLQGMKLRNKDQIGEDLWRIYDSEASLLDMAGFYDATRDLLSGIR
ncbi:MAG: bifunctional diaminohydroxyphosphoribosylaminopyrimidine deaminase/5-amino-6-(5-phosphoribosylamino)uracil reductase RibD [Proteobacteria bacterium]|nr:bifunctional diaminohydroxyphosphoribosylaminopyrimidine deaminase/5-amino-6-(5-phosphoribosylamino)uracil reductase RibD [Pseudomonadota bacterium]